MEKRMHNGVEWTLYSTAEATKEKLRQPHTTILLNQAEAAWRRRVRDLATRDPQGYLEACRRGEGLI